MRILSELLTRENEDYLTIPAIRKFAKANNIKKISDCDRPELLEELEAFGNISLQNESVLKDWFEDILSEGIKTLYIVRSNNLLESYRTNKTLGIFNQLCNENKYITGLNANKKITIYRIKEYESKLGKMVRISFAKKTCYQSRINEDIQVINLPIQIVLMLDHNFILIQFKSKSGLFEYEENLEDVSEHLSDDKIANECVEYIKSKLQLTTENHNTNKNTLYNLLNKYTKTPSVIKDKIESLRDEIITVAENIRTELCSVGENNKQDILWDLMNIIEKYISINTEDRSIFIDDREAYPIKLISSDEEDSRVEQCSGNYEPLQMKSIFFDNKKMMQKSEQCDGIYLKYKRIDNMYFNNEVDVHIQVKTRYMVLKFTKYTPQEDMENVLNSIISSESRSENN